MKWVQISNTVVDIDRYRLFRRIGNVIVGLNEYEISDVRQLEAVEVFPNDEQAAMAFEAFSVALGRLKVD